MTSKEWERATKAVEVSTRKLQRLTKKIEDAKIALEELQRELEKESDKNAYLSQNPIFRDENGGDDFAPQIPSSISVTTPSVTKWKTRN